MAATEAGRVTAHKTTTREKANGLPVDAEPVGQVAEEVDRRIEPPRMPACVCGFVQEVPQIRVVEPGPGRAAEVGVGRRRSACEKAVDARLP